MKKKGVGYGSDSNTNDKQWDINSYVQNKKNQSEWLQQLISMLEALLIIDSELWQPPQAVLKSFCSSALLPLLENVFGNNSLLEICKEAQLMYVYLRFVRTIAKHDVLIPCLL